MKKITCILPLLMVVLFFGCATSSTLPDNPIIFTTKTNNRYMSILWEDREYVPYGALDPAKVGECIGYYESDGSKVYVFSLKGLSEEDWLADSLDLDNCNEGMVFKNIKTSIIPDGFSSDYAWNK